MNPCHLEIGLHRSLQRPLEGSHEVNVIRGGPGQLLDWVEVQLGTNGPDIPWTDRVVAYHRRLQDQPGAPFSRSFQADPWATAARLLKRRDELLMGGWTPTVPVEEPLVQDLARIEGPGLPPGTPDRIRTVLEALAAGLQLPEHTVHLDEETTDWPPLWQGLLGHLNVSPAPPASAPAPGALGAIQRNLLEERDEAATVDASLAAVAAGSRHAAVQFVARSLRGRNAAVYCPDPSLATMLDAALHADGQPTMGAPRESHGQPCYQVLPLVLDLLWEPVNPYVLLDFLLLPVSPVRGLAHHLARALEKQPGYRSDAWNRAIQTILADDEDGTKAAKTEKWLDHERIPVGDELPTSLVEARCGLVAQWAAGRAQYESQRDEADEGLVQALQSAASQASALGSLSAQLGASISEAQLARLLDEVRDGSSIDVPHAAQAGGAVFVSSLADVRETEHLVWLGTTAPKAARSPWTPRQVELLARHDIHVGTDPRALRKAELRGLLQARSLLVVEVPSEDRAHPLWLRIHGDLIVHGRRGGELPRLEQIIEEVAPTRRLVPTVMPTQRAQWALARPVPQPGHTSATALENQLACPLRWTLHHALEVRYGAISSIPEGQRLKGIFAHDLMERVFQPGAPPTPDEAEERLCALFDELLPRNAAPLAIPRKLAERNRLRRELRSSVRAFAEVLQRGGHEIIGIELPVEGDVDGVVLRGNIDCVLRSEKGESIVDFKLRGGERLEQAITTGRALQLATYGHSRGGAGAAAYFVLSSGEVITPKAGALEGAPRAVEGPDIASTWARFSQALRDGAAWMQDGPVTARPMQDPAQWSPGVNVALDAEAEEHGVCRYCDLDVLCGRRVLS